MVHDIRHINYTVKLCKSQRKTNYTRQNEKSLGSLAGVTMLDYDSTLVITYSKNKLEVIKDSITFCISLMMVKNLRHNWWILLKYVKSYNMVYSLVSMGSRTDELVTQNWNKKSSSIKLLTWNKFFDFESVT